MIELARIDQTYNQPEGTYYCILASYAICHNYFTRMPVTDGFQAYSRHFRQPVSSGTGEAEYEAHFDRSRNGFEILRELHEQSPDPYFQEARSKFIVEHRRFTQLSEIDALQLDLVQHQDWMACLSIAGLFKGCHIVCYFFLITPDGPVSYIRDPAKSIQHIFLPLFKEALVVRPV